MTPLGVAHLFCMFCYQKPIRSMFGTSDQQNPQHPHGGFRTEVGALISSINKELGGVQTKELMIRSFLEGRTRTRCAEDQF